jgi:hypothetical protein
VSIVAGVKVARVVPLAGLLLYVIEFSVHESLVTSLTFPALTEVFATNIRNVACETVIPASDERLNFK